MTGPYEAQKFEWERTAGDWRDITSHVERFESSIGRPSDFDTAESGTALLVLNNTDHRWTPGNVSSPEYPYWRQGRRIRVTETIGYRTFNTCTMYVQAPEITEWAQSGDQTIAVPLVDRLGRLDSARSFVSTLTEYILYNRGTALKAYWSLLDRTGPYAASAGPSQANAVLNSVFESNLTGANGALIPVAFGSGTQVPGDDLAPAKFTAAHDAGQAIASNFLTVPLSPNITMDNTQAITLVAWVYLDAATVNSSSNVIMHLTGSPPLLGLYRNTLNPPVSLGEWEAFAPALSVDILAGPAATQQWQLVAARYQLTTAANAQELWIGGSTVLQATATAPPASASWPTLNIGRWVCGTIAHVQVYVDSPSGWGRTEFLDQLDVGFNAFDRQRTDERIRTVCRYAGMSDADLQLDTGVALMGPASLAGQSPGSLVRAAGETERGRLFADGTDRIVLHNRTRTYNV